MCNKRVTCKYATESLSLEVFQNHGDVVLRDVGSGHGGSGLCLDLMVPEFFSNLNKSLILGQLD